MTDDIPIVECPENPGGHYFETVGAEVEGYGAMSTAVYQVCRFCGGVRRDERPRIVEATMTDEGRRMEPERIQKGSKWSRWFFRQIGMQSARSERLGADDD